MDSKTGLMLIFSLIGILSLLFLSQILEPRVMLIQNLSIENQSYFQLNKEIKIIANITSINQVKNSTTFLKLEDETGILAGVIFKANPKILEINKSKTYAITGKLSEYENETNIIINKINPIIISKIKT